MITDSSKCEFLDLHYPKLKEHTILQAIKTFLGRPFTPFIDKGDFQLITRNGHPGITMLAYKGFPIGRMYYAQGNSFDLGWEIDYVFETSNSFA